MIRKREGFTLVELLVVIAIIVILAAILFPIFAKARDKAQQAKCINNLKQMSAAIELYEDDYSGSIMPASIGSGAPGTESASNAAIFWGYMWGDLMEPYVKQKKKHTDNAGTAGKAPELFTCPSAPTEGATDGNSWQMGKSYGYNPYLLRTVLATNVPAPALTLRVTETASYRFDPHSPAVEAGQDPLYQGGSWYCPMPRRSGTLALYAPGWHSDYNSCLWVDGHVSSLTWQQVMKTDNYQGTTDPNTWCRLAPKEGFTAEQG